MSEDVIGRPPSNVPMPKLTRRETVVLQELHRGLTLEEIAARLYVSKNTVKTQVRSLYRKLGVSSRSDAVAMVDTRSDVAGVVRQRPPAVDLALGAASRRSADGRGSERSSQLAGTTSSSLGLRRRIGTGPGSTLPARPDLTSGRDGASSSPRGEVPYGPHLASVRWTSGQPVDDWVPSCAALARLARQQKAAREVLDAIDAAIATEVADTRSRGATWSEIGIALKMTRQAVRRRFDETRQYCSG